MVNVIQLQEEVDFSFGIFPQFHIFLKTRPARWSRNAEYVLKATGEDKMSRLCLKKGKKLYVPKDIIFFTDILSSQCLGINNTYLDVPT